MARRARGWHLWRPRCSSGSSPRRCCSASSCVLAVGSYLYRLDRRRPRRRPRRRSAAEDACGRDRTAQDQFDATDQHRRRRARPSCATTSSSQLRPRPGRPARYVVLTRSVDNTVAGRRCRPIQSGGVGLLGIPDELRAAVAADPDRQQTPGLAITDEQTGEQPSRRSSSGSQVELPAAGHYDLYFVFPMDREAGDPRRWSRATFARRAASPWSCWSARSPTS